MNRWQQHRLFLWQTVRLHFLSITERSSLIFHEKSLPNEKSSRWMVSVRQCPIEKHASRRQLKALFFVVVQIVFRQSLGPSFSLTNIKITFRTFNHEYSSEKNFCQSNTRVIVLIRARKKAGLREKQSCQKTIHDLLIFCFDIVETYCPTEIASSLVRTVFLDQTWTTHFAQSNTSMCREKSVCQKQQSSCWFL